MSNTIYLPYTYLIGWSKLNWWYYGCEFGKCHKIANPNNLWKIYFTSSKEVAIIRDIYGEPDIIQIRKTFQNGDDCLKWETKVLKRMKVVNKTKWLNKTDSKAIEAMPGKKNPFYGKHHTEETKKKLAITTSKAQKGKPKSLQHKINVSLGLKGKPKTKEAKINIRASRLLQGQTLLFGVTCLHCLKTFDHQGNFKQHLKWALHY